jgi:hypothetical protein
MQFWRWEGHRHTFVHNGSTRLLSVSEVAGCAVTLGLLVQFLESCLCVGEDTCKSYSSGLPGSVAARAEGVAEDVAGNGGAEPMPVLGGETVVHPGPNPGPASCRLHIRAFRPMWTKGSDMAAHRIKREAPYTRWGRSSVGSRIVRVTSLLSGWRRTARWVVSNRQRSSCSGAWVRLRVR